MAKEHPHVSPSKVRTLADCEVGSVFRFADGTTRRLVITQFVEGTDTRKPYVHCTKLDKPRQQSHYYACGSRTLSPDTEVIVVADRWVRPE